MKLNFAAAVVLTVAIFGSAAGSATAIERQDEENRAALLRGVSANEEEQKQAAHGRRLGDTNATLTPLPNGGTCDSSDHCASGWCKAGVCKAPQCFTYDGLGSTNNIPVTQQCKEAKKLNRDINCCTDENGNDACENFHGTVCVTDSLGACTSAGSCFSAGATSEYAVGGSEVLPVRIEPGSCLSHGSCHRLVNSTVASGSCNGDMACESANGITVGSSSCNEPQACSRANDAVIMGSSCNGEGACGSANGITVESSSCNAQGACQRASKLLIMGSSCNANSACFGATALPTSTKMCSTKYSCFRATKKSIENSGGTCPNDCCGTCATEIYSCASDWVELTCLDRD